MPKVQIDITAKDDATAILNKVNAAIAQSGKSTDSLASSVFKGNMMYGLAEKGLGMLKDALGEVTIGSLKTFASFEQTNIALTTMLGSTEKAANLMEQMQVAAAKTPFAFSEIATSGKQLIAFGVKAEDVVGTLNKLGDVASGLSQPLGDIVYLYGQIKTQGRAMTQDLMQFAMRGIPIYEELGKVLKIPTNEIKEYASKGMITFKDIDQVFNNLTQSGGKFAGLMDAQTESLGGKWSNFNDQLEKTQVLLGKTFSGDAKVLVEFMTNMLGVINGSLSSTGEELARHMGLVDQINQRLDGTKSAVEVVLEQFKGSTDLWVFNNVLEEALETSDDVEHKLKGWRERYGETLVNAKVYNEYLKGNLHLTESRAAELRKINLAHAEEVQFSSVITEGLRQQVALAEQYYAKASKTVKKDPTEAEKKAWADKAKEAEKYFQELREQRAMALADEAGKAELALKKQREELRAKRAYFKSEQDYYEAQRIIESNAIDEANKRSRDKERQAQIDFWRDLSAIRINFWTGSSDAAINAVGQMGNAISASFRNLASAYGSVLEDIAKRGSDTGLKLGDAFKIGASAATTALESISAVLTMQNAIFQSNCNKQIEYLHRRIDAEVKAYEDSLQSDYEITQEKEMIRERELEAYRATLTGMTDAEIAYAMAKKDVELQAANDEMTTAEKTQAFRDSLEEQYAMEEYRIELAAFKAEQEYARSMIIIQTALGVVSAWASCMKYGLVGIAMATGLTALFTGLAAKQLSLVDKMIPPQPPQFAEGVENFEGGWAIVGERGRELVKLPRGSSVIPNTETETILGGDSSMYAQVNVYIDSMLYQKSLVKFRKASSYGGY